MAVKYEQEQFNKAKTPVLVLASKLGKQDMYKCGQLQKLAGDANCCSLTATRGSWNGCKRCNRGNPQSVLLGRDGVSKPGLAPEAEATPGWHQ